MIKNAPHLTLGDPFKHLHQLVLWLNSFWCQTECLTVLIVPRRKSQSSREEKLLSSLFLISTCTNFLYSNASCFIQYILQKKKKNKNKATQGISVHDQLEPLQLPWKQVEKGFVATNPTSPPFSKKGKSEEGHLPFIFKKKN